MTKRKNVLLSEILHLAADKYLYSCTGPGEHSTYQYSCYAINNASWELCGGNYYENNQIKQGLKNLGLKIGKSGSAFYKLDKYGPTQESQAARFFWLKWCALMAEEQGV